MKKCKGTGKAIGSGCGQEFDSVFKYGMCRSCYTDWLFNSDEGRKKLSSTMLRAGNAQQEMRSRAINKLYRNEPRKSRKLEEMTFRELKIVTQKVCNKYIRLRDEVNHGICISSENKIDDAGHFFSVGANEALRYSPQNIHGQNRGDNFFKSGNLPEYEKGLRLRYGDVYMDELYDLHRDTMSKKVLTRDYVLSVNRLYKYLTKKGIWVYTHTEFEYFLQIMDLK